MAALLSLSQFLDEIIPNVQSYFLLCPRKHMKSLHENAIFLHQFLQHFPANSFQGRITDVSSQLELIIRSHISTQESRDDIDRVREEFGRCITQVNSIVQEAVEIKNNSWDHEDVLPPSNIAPDSPPRRIPRGKGTIVGIDQDLIGIKHRAVGEEEDLQIIPITGMGGIGKTTLARLVYEDRLISDHFDTRHWVTVSQEYRVQDLLSEILSNKGSSDEDVELLIERVYKNLKGTRYLIVMDDMWHAEAWDSVRRAFPDECNGSRIIITTRLSEVAHEICSADSPLHQMNLLDEDRSWELLREIVYAKDRIHHHMEEIGKQIARSCKGLPLAIAVIGGLLKINKTKRYWESIAENVTAASASANDDQVSGLFSLSYNHLPHHLKQCFLYLGFFPEDYKIPVKKLFKLWMAHGFLNSEKPKIMEELAEEYLEDLVERNLVLVSGRRSNGRIRDCNIHDVLRDLSLRKGDEANFQEMVKTQQRSLIHSANINFLTANLEDSPPDSSLPQLGTLSKKQKLSMFTARFKSLRVLDELELKTNHFPDQVFELVNLRYLAFTYSFSAECRLPSSVSKLQNLQTLIVNRGGLPADYSCRLVLPVEIWKMPQLRHLMLMRNTVLLFPAEGERDPPVLGNLLTLSNVMNFSFSLEAIKSFPNVKKLRFQYNSIEPKKWGKFCLGNLAQLHQVEEMNFRFHAGSAHVDRNPIQTNLEFPQKLKKLTLTRSGIPWEKMSMVGSLPNLQVLKLMKDSFVGRIWDPIEGEFLKLKYLEIEDTNVVEWNADSSHFPSLEKLVIRWCYQLKEVPSSVGEIPNLRSLTMQNCNVEAEESVRRIREEQEDLGNDVLQIKIFETSKPPATSTITKTRRRNRNRNRNRNQNENGNANQPTSESETNLRPRRLGRNDELVHHRSIY